MSDLPQFLRDLLASPPRHGDPNGGVHRWMFRVARHLHAHRSKEDIVALLGAALEGCGRFVPMKEITDAVEHSLDRAWKKKTERIGNWQEGHKTGTWPEVNLQRRTQVISQTDRSLYDLWEHSSIRYEEGEAEEIVPRLFPPSDPLC